MTASVRHVLTPHQGLGYATITDRRGTREFDTCTCIHCNRVWAIAGGPMADLGGWCRLCQQPICSHCAARGGCQPFEDKLDRYEARMRLYAQMEL